jgi:hypothetical protein
MSQPFRQTYVYCIQRVVFDFHILVLWKMFKIVTFVNMKLFTWLFERIGILLTCEKHLHGRFMALIGQV